MRIVAISDMHGYLPDEMPEGDLLLIGGDITPVWDHNLAYQRTWFTSVFAKWLKNVPVRHRIGVGGNHDFLFQNEEHRRWNVPWVYLKDETVEVAGLKIHGSPYCNKFGNWAFMLPEGMLREKYALIPRDVDILITHGPPWGYGDKVAGFSMTKRGMIEEQHVGSTSLTNMITYEDWPNLKLHVFGHIHEGYGEYNLNGTKLLNVSHVDADYIDRNDPVVIDL